MDNWVLALSLVSDVKVTQIIAANTAFIKYH